MLALALLSGCATSGYGHLSPEKQADVRRVEAYLNGVTGMKAAFRQEGPGAGEQSAGRFVYAPGRLRLDYVLPHIMELVAGEGRLVLNDQESGAVTRLSLKRNPLGLLLRRPVRFDEEVQVTDVRETPGLLQISLAEAHDPSQGLLTLRFADQAGKLTLSGLEGVDARSNHFIVTLDDVTEGVSFPSSVFISPG